MKENMRVLRKDGILFTISMSQDFICKLLYGKWFMEWSRWWIEIVVAYYTDVYLIPQPAKTLLTNPLFLYVTSKKEDSKPFQFHFAPTDGFL